MSTWLTNVGNFLEQLDVQAAVTAAAVDDDDENDDDNDVQQEQGQENLHVVAPAVARERDREVEKQHVVVFKTSSEIGSTDYSAGGDQEKSPPSAAAANSTLSDTEETNELEPLEKKNERSFNFPEIVERIETMNAPAVDSNFNTNTPDNRVSGRSRCDTALGTPFRTPEQQSPLVETTPENEEASGVKNTFDREHVELLSKRSNLLTRNSQLQQELSAANKEARTLRRNLAVINEQLIAADKEIEAQRKELEDVAVRLQKDRIKYKQDRDTTATKHAALVQQLQRAHQAMLAEAQVQAQQRIDEIREQLQAIKQEREQEDGNWHKEFADAVDREQTALDECAALQEEKTTLLAQIFTLQAQQEVLGSRLESITATADNAMAREREAESRLDEALSLHARQVSLRQARETELERTVTELSAAIVAERNKATTSSSALADPQTDVTTTLKDQAPGDGTAQGVQDNAPNALSGEIETLQSQLEQERQQTATLQNELREVARERAEDASVTQIRQLQHDRKIAELTQQITDLRKSVNEARHDLFRRDSLPTGREEDSATEEESKRIKSLSEEVVRQREKISNCNCEISALRTRLQVAMNRAVVAEAAAEAACASGTDSDWPTEPERGNMRRRSGGSKKRSAVTEAPTMRSALRLDGLQLSGSNQSIGKSLDVLDGFLAKSGQILRYNPVARLLFGTFLHALLVSHHILFSNCL